MRYSLIVAFCVLLLPGVAMAADTPPPALNAPLQADPAPTVSPTVAPTSAPAPAPAPAPAATTAPASACFPACRAGFTCHQGACVSLCNPPCAQGYACTADGQCAAPQIILAAPATAAYVDPAAAKAEKLAAREAKKKQKEEAKAHRVKMLQRLRITMNMEWSWALADLWRSCFVGALGIQRNLTPFFGIKGRVGGVIGYSSDAAFTTGDRTLTGGIQADLTPYFGPLGKFFIGPMFWFTNYWNKDDYIEDIDWDYDGGRIHTRSGPIGGLGIDMGVLMGPESNFGINWRVKTALIQDTDIPYEPTFYAEVGMTYHFLVGD